MFEDYELKPAPNSRNRSISIRLLPAEDDKIDEECKRLGVSKANFIRSLFKAYFEQKNETE